MRDFPVLADEELYVRRDPVTGRREVVMRRRHDFTHSPKLIAFRRCVGKDLRGRTYRGHGAREDSILVREGMSAAARRCSREVAAIPADSGTSEHR